MKSLMKIDPFRAIRRWDPIDDLRRVQTEMDRLFERFLGGEISVTGPSGRWVPTAESFTKDGKLFYRIELPGMDPKHLDVSTTENELIVKGERRETKEAKEEDYLYHEIRYGSFERHFGIPQGAKVEELKARFANGVLEVSVPVPEVSKAKKVPIEGSVETREETTVKKAA